MNETWTPPFDAARLTNDRGTFAWWLAAPHVYVVSMSGNMSYDMAELLLAQLEPLYAKVDRVHGVYECLTMSSYEPRCRADLTSFVARYRTRTSLDIGLKMPLVAMGVTVANLVLGNMIRVHRDLPSLQKALSAALGVR